MDQPYNLLTTATCKNSDGYISEFSFLHFKMKISLLYNGWGPSN